MITLVPDLAAEDPIGIGRIGENDRDQDAGSYKHEDEAGFRRRGFMDAD
jgi:hypothetical protein